MRFLRRPVVLMVLGALVFAAGGIAYVTRDTTKTVSTANVCVFPPCRASGDPKPARGYEGAYVVADPANPDHLVVSDADVLQGFCGFHTTFNRGRDWTDGLYELPDGFTGCRINPPSGGHVASGTVALGSAGRVYAVFGSANADDNRRESVLVATSNDGGKTFGRAQVAIRPTGPDVGLGRPLLTVVPGSAGKDTLLLSSWTCHPGVPSGTQCDGVVFAKSDDGGSTYTDPVAVNDPPAGQNASQPAVDREGTIYVTFQRRYADGPVELFLAKSGDGGKTFAVSPIDRQVQIGLQYDAAKIVADPLTNDLYTVWADTRTGRAQIFFRKSSDKGATWSQPAALISPDPGYSGSSRSPWMSVAPNGRIDVVYYHTGPSPDVQKFDDVYWAYSVDGGDHFFSRQVNEAPIDRSKGYSGPAGALGDLGNHYPPTVSSVDGAAYVVWSDTAGADDISNSQDVYLRRMDVQGAGSPP